LQDGKKMSKINLVFDGKEAPSRRIKAAQVVPDRMSPILEQQVKRLVNINSSLQSTESKGISKSPKDERSKDEDLETI
jgi:hypothetical protein